MESEKKIQEFEKPILRYEKLASKIIGKGKNRVYLYPIPYIVFYLCVAYIPHVYTVLTKHEILSYFYYDYYVTTGWIALMIIVSYSLIFYKKTYYQSIKTLQNDGIITESVHKLAVDQLTNKKIFFTFLIVFEFLLNFSWYTDFYSIDNIILNVRWDIPGLVIAVVIIPIAAEIFTAASTGSRLPKIIKNRISINILHFDYHGGLRPFGNIMLFYVGIYVSTLVISLLVFEEIRNSIILLPVFLLIFGINVALPQKSLHDKLNEKKREWLSSLQHQYNHYNYVKYLDPKIVQENSSNVEFKSNYLILIHTIKDHVNKVQALSFDLVTLYKVLTALLLPLLALIYDYVI